MTSAVHTHLAQMLRATGLHDGRTSDLMARWADAFYTTMAARTNTTPQELYDRFPLRVSGDLDEQEAADSAKRSQKAFRRWFGASKVVDGRGDPLVVYHGGQKLTAWQDKTSPRTARNTLAAAAGADRRPQIYGGHAQAGKDAYGSMLTAAERQHLDRPVHFFTDDQMVAEGYGDQGSHYEVRSEYLRMERPLDLRIDVVGFEEVEQHLRAILGPDFEIPLWGQHRYISQSLRLNWSEVRDKVEALGFDGLIFHDTDVQDRGKHTSYAVFHPEQIKAADANDGSFDLDDPDRLSQGPVVAPSSPALGSAAHQRNDANAPRQATDPNAHLGLRSALLEAVLALPTEHASPTSWRQAITGILNRGAAKAQEVHWTGLLRWLDDQDALAGPSRRISRQQIVDHLLGEGVRLREAVLSDEALRELPDGWYILDTGATRGEEQFVIFSAEDTPVAHGRTQQAALESLIESDLYAEDLRAPLYAGHVVAPHLQSGPTSSVQASNDSITTPSPSRYREVLLILDTERGRKIERRMQLAALDRARPLSASEKAEFESLRDFALLVRSSPGGAPQGGDGAKGSFLSKHWAQPDVLVHFRVDDRIDVEGKRVLMVHEIQSDWGQIARSKGFGLQVQSSTEGVPEAPFVATAPNGKTPVRPNTQGWVHLALKRIALMAAQGGYDRVAFITGEQASELFGVRQLVTSIKIWEQQTHPEGTESVAREMELRTAPGAIVRCLVGPLPLGKLSSKHPQLHGKHLADVVGPRLAQQALSEPRAQTLKTDGLAKDITLGDHGMRAFYDEIVPAALKHLLPTFEGRLAPSAARAQLRPIAVPMPQRRLRVMRSLPDQDGRPRWYVIDDATGEYVRRPPPREGSQSDVAFGSILVAHRWEHEHQAQDAMAVIDPQAAPINVYGFDVTPAMRETLSKGLPLFQGAAQARRGAFDPRTLEIALGPKADASTWIHETGHFFLEVLADLALQPNAPAPVVRDFETVLSWFGVTREEWTHFTLDQKRPHHERWAQAMEQYVMEGKAPSEELRPVMEVFSAWLRAIYVSTRDFLDQAAGSLTKRTIRTPTRATFGPSETLFRKALADQQAYTENPRAWFESRLHDVAQRLAALGVEAVMSGNGRPARFFSSDGEVPASGVTGQAGLLAKLYAQINAEYDAAETGRPPQFMPVGLDPDIELMPTTDRQRVVDLLTRGLRGELPTHAPLMQAPATPDPDPGPCRLTLTDDIRRVMDRLLSEQALDSWACGDEEESAATDRRERMRA